MFTHHSQRHLRSALERAGWSEARTDGPAAELEACCALGLKPSDEWIKFMAGLGGLRLAGERPDRGVVSFILGTLEAADMEHLAMWAPIVGSPLHPQLREDQQCDNCKAVYDPSATDAVISNG